MGKLIIAATTILILFFIAESCDKEKKEVMCPVLYGTLVDARDGNRYPTVSICSQIWMAENLRFQMEGVYTNASNPSVEYGFLYTYKQAKMACPKGWHLPTDEEWKRLEIALGMPKDATDKKDWRGEKEGRYLKATSGWERNLDNSNSAGFRALPAGNFETGTYEHLGQEAHFWTASEVDPKKAWTRVLDGHQKKVKRYTETKNSANSCRCIKDD